MQPDRGLAGAGRPLDTQRVRQTGPDEDVLLGLDRGHDVAHRAGARPFDLRLQDVRDARPVAGGGQVLVLVRGQPALREAEPAASAYAHRLTRTGAVERPRHAGPPVDHQRLAARLAGNVSTPDVEGLVLLGAEVVVVVEPAEEQRHRRVVTQRLHPAVQGLPEVLGGDVVAADSRQPGRVLTHPLQRRPGVGQVGALGGQDGLGLGHARTSGGGGSEPTLPGGTGPVHGFKSGVTRQRRVTMSGLVSSTTAPARSMIASGTPAWRRAATRCSTTRLKSPAVMSIPWWASRSERP